MKKFVLAIPLLLLSSCGGGELSSDNSSISNSSISNSSISSEESISSIEEKVYEKVTFNKEATLHGISSNFEAPKLESIGEQNILVVPITIKGFEELSKEEERLKLEKVFFGSSDDVTYESVSSYYEKSSYGKLKLKGKVTPFFNPNLTAQEIYDLKDDTYGDYGLFALSSMVEAWYKENFDDIKDYDKNKDGYIDAIWMVYFAPNRNNYKEDLPDNLWAFSFSNFNNQGLGDVDDPKVMTYGWAGYDFMYQGYGEDQLDAHVYIHETGHMLGLEDYYSLSGASISPMGKIDMMDDDIGDHSAYSKFALGWVEPYLIDDLGSITLNSFTETGDCLLFKTENYNGTPFDEYFMIDYVTPTGLNEFDYKNGYLKRYGKIEGTEPTYGYLTPGVRITYINSVAIDKDLNLTDDLDKMTKVKFDNSPYGNMAGIINPTSGMYHILTTLITKNCGYSNHGLFESKFTANSSHLFVAEDEFNLRKDSQYRNLTQSGTNKYVKEGAGFFKYNVVVEENDDSSCTLRFESIQ